MGVDTNTYRGRIGLFQPKNGQSVIIVNVCVNLSGGLKAIGSVAFIGILLLMAGVESNPGPRTSDEESMDTETIADAEGSKDGIPERSVPLQDPFLKRLKDVGLESSYWSNVLNDKLGVKTLIQLQHLNKKESYSILSQHTKHPWEKNALKQLLGYNEYRENENEKNKGIAKDAEKTLQNIIDLQKQGLERTNSKIQTEEQKLRQILDVEDEKWLKETKNLSLDNAIQCFRSHISDLDKVYSYGNHLKPPQILENASGSVVLRGILMSKDIKETLKIRQQVIKSPEIIDLSNPIIQQTDITEDITSKEQVQEFHQTMEVFGLKGAANLSVGFKMLGIQAEVAGGIKEDQRTTTTSSKFTSFQSRHVMSIVPTKCYTFSKRDLRLSEDAVSDLLQIDKLITATDHTNAVSEKCKNFLDDYGSHVNVGTIHFGGIYEWIATYESKTESSKSDVKELLQRTVNACVSFSKSSVLSSIGISGGVSLDILKENVKGDTHFSETEFGKIQLTIRKTGGPQEVTSLPLWKSGLVSQNSTWCVVDRGNSGYIGVWDLIEKEKGIFSNEDILRKQLKSTWEKMNGILETTESRNRYILGAMLRAEDAIKKIPGWINDPCLPNNCYGYVTELYEAIQALTDESKSLKFWISQLKNDPEVTKFLLLITNPDFPASEIERPHIKHRVMQLLAETQDEGYPNKTQIMDNIDPVVVEENVPNDLTGGIESVQEFLQIQHNFLSDTNCPNTDSEESSLTNEIKTNVALAVSKLFRRLQQNNDYCQYIFFLGLLLPLDYQIHRKLFDKQISISQLKLFVEKGFEKLKIYQQMKGNGEKLFHAYVLHSLLEPLMLKNESSRVTIFKTCFHYIQESIDYEVNEVVNQYAVTEPYNWEKLLHCLECLKNNDSSFKDESLIRLEQIENALSIGQTPKSHESTIPTMSQIVANERLDSFLELLGLKSYFPEKIKLQDVTKICLDKDTSGVMITDIPWLILRKLMTVDHESQDRILTRFVSDTKDKEGAPKEMDSLEDLLDDDEISSLVQTEFHPADILCATFLCCDYMLRQVLASKLFVCRLSLPFLIPETMLKQMLVLMWPLRAITIESRKENKTSETSLVEHECKRVSFIRIDNCSWSKSKLMNDVLSNQAHSTFYNKDCPFGSVKRDITDGIIETQWYLPTGKESDPFSDVIMFLNLRGDAKRFNQQVSIMTDISNITAVMLNCEEINDENTIDYLKYLHGSSSSILLVLTTKSGCTEEAVKHHLKRYVTALGKETVRGTKFILPFKDGRPINSAVMRTEIRDKIKLLLSGHINETLENKMASQRHQEKPIMIDESNPDCKNAKDSAKQITDCLHGIPMANLKQELAPLHGSLWLKLSRLEKKLEKVGFHQEDEIKNVQNQMSSIYKKQLALCGQISPMVQIFISTLLQNINDENFTFFFIQWLKMDLDQMSRETLPELRLRYHQLWEQLKVATKNNETSTSDRLRKSVNEAEKQLADASFGFEHLVRELGQIFEIVTKNKNHVSKVLVESVELLPKAIAKLILLGIPFEIMDGDAANIPLRWVKSVLESLNEHLKNNKVLALSVLGIQSSGKSTLLNSMFGLQFAVSAGRCTRGIFLQLIPVYRTSKKSEFDYVFVIDTEGLRAPELGHQKYDHDNELATLVLGLGDVTLVNVKGENTAEVKDILQIVIQAFLRLQAANDKLKLQQSCMFIHQNVSAANPGDKLMHGRQKLVDDLDSMTSEAAEQENRTNIRAFNQVIQFDSKKHVWYFPGLWQGDPPMAPLNPGYSEKVEKVRTFLLDEAAVSKKSFMTIPSKIQHIEDLWRGILSENFVFSFRNTLEVKAYKAFEKKSQELLWDVKQSAFEYTENAIIELKNSENKQQLNETLSAKKEGISVIVSKKSNEAIKELELFCDNYEYQSIVINWLPLMRQSFDTNAREINTKMKKDLDNSFNEITIDMMSSQKQVHLEKQINEKAKHVANQMMKRQGDKTFSEEEISATFDEMWIKWCTDLNLEGREEDVHIGRDMLKILYDEYVPWAQDVKKELEKQRGKTSMLQQLSHSLRTEDILKSHLKIDTDSFLHFFSKDKEPFSTCRERAWQIINELFQIVDSKIDYLVKKDTRYNQAYGQEIMKLIKSHFDVYNTSRKGQNAFTTTPYLHVKISVHIFMYAMRKFNEMNKMYMKKHSAKAKLDAYRETAYNLFQNMVKKTTNEATTAGLFCDCLKRLLPMSVVGKMPRLIVSEVLNDFNHTKERLIVRIMDDLAKKAKFGGYQGYISDPKTYASTWLKKYIDRKLYSKEDGDDRYSNISKSIIKNVIESVMESVKGATEHINTSQQKTMQLWMRIFQESVKNEISIPQNAMSHVLERNIDNYANFQEIIIAQLPEIERSVTQQFDNENEDSVTWEGETPYESVFQELWGCEAQCPLCREPCRITKKDHLEISCHDCIQHRISGVGGERSTLEKRSKLWPYCCNYNVNCTGLKFSCIDCDYKCRETHCNTTGDTYVWHRYTEIRKFLPDWDIAPSSDMYLKCEYWMWFMAKFRQQIADMHGAEVPDIPDDWRSITQKDAIDSLRKI